LAITIRNIENPFQRVKIIAVFNSFIDLELRRAELDGEVFEMLFTLTDFLAFKEMFVDYKVMKQSGAFENILQVINLEFHNDQI